MPASFATPRIHGTLLSSLDPPRPGSEGIALRCGEDSLHDELAKHIVCSGCTLIIRVAESMEPSQKSRPAMFLPIRSLASQSTRVEISFPLGRSTSYRFGSGKG